MLKSFMGLEYKKQKGWQALMIYAPVMIITCNRDQHLARCIESLGKNSYASETELFISVDYPPADKYVEGWKRVCRLLENPIEGFRKVNIYIQEKNLGPTGNAEFLYQKIFAVYDRVIISEDDNEFAPNFIEYMDKGLMLYERHPKVYGVGGYAFDYGFDSHGNNIVALADFNMWGCGLWREKEKIMNEQLSYKLWEKKARNPFAMCRLYYNRKRLFSRMLGELLQYEHKEQMDRTDINRGIVLALNGWCTVHPVLTKVRNWGWDGSGLNIIGTDAKQGEYEGQYLDQESCFEYQSDIIRWDSHNNRLMDDNDEWNRDRARWFNDPLTYLLYWMLGKKNFFKYIRGKERKEN